MNKTKAELMEEMEELKAELVKKEKEIENLERYKKYAEVGDEMKAMHTAFMNSGFTNEQAFQALIELIRGASNMVRPSLF